MARQQHVSTVITGGVLTVDEVETVSFATNVTACEIDLNENNATSLRSGIASWVVHARIFTSPTTSRRNRYRTSTHRRPVDRARSGTIRQ